MYTFCELLYIPYTHIYIYICMYIYTYIYIYECMYGSIPSIMAVEKTGVIWLNPRDAHLPGWISWRASWNASMAGLSRCENGSPAMGRTAFWRLSHRSCLFLVVEIWRKKVADIFKTPPIIRRDLGVWDHQDIWRRSVEPHIFFAGEVDWMNRQFSSEMTAPSKRLTFSKEPNFVTLPKTNMTMEIHHEWRCISYWKMWIFQPVVR